MKRIKFHPVVNVHGVQVMVDANIVPGRPAPWCGNPSCAAYADTGDPLEVDYERVISCKTTEDLTGLFTEFEELDKYLCDAIVLAWQGVGRCVEEVGA